MYIPNNMYKRLHDMFNGDNQFNLHLQLDPISGNVAMGSGLHAWGFTLRKMAAFYSRRLGVDEERMLQRLWGDNFYNPATRKWKKTPGEGYVRGFNKFVLEPLYKVLNVTLSEQVDIEEVLQKVDVALNAQERALQGKERMRTVMQRWLPAGEAMMHMLVLHLPSPKTAQAYRTELLYEGPMDDDAAVGKSRTNLNDNIIIIQLGLEPKLLSLLLTKWGFAYGSPWLTLRSY